MTIRHTALASPFVLGPDLGLGVLDLHAGVRALLEQILFTAPGERVNRPSFGVGVQTRVFEPNSPFLANEIRIALEQQLWEHLGDQIRVLGVEAVPVETELHVTVRYSVRGAVDGESTLETSVPVEETR